MRISTFEQSFWITGYYDDFHSSRMVADDKNSAMSRTLSHTISHHGNTLGGVNILSPRFYYSYFDRLRTGHVAASDPMMALDYYDFGSTADNLLTVNRGIHEWISVELNDTDGSLPEEQAQLTVPTSLCANRHKFNGAGTEGYLRFFNGHDTGGHYYAPTGTIDPTLGADRCFPPDTTLTIFPENRGGYARLVSANLSKEIKHTFFTSVYTGEAPQAALSFSETRPSKYLHEVKSPSQQQFLVSSLYNDASATGTTRLLSYDGEIRMRGIGEMFHLRIAAHKIGDWTFDNYILKIGYKNTATYTTTADDFSDTASLATIDISLAQLGLTGSMNKWEEGQASANAYDSNAIWADIYVVFDFNTNTWDAYANSNTVHAFASGAINTSVTMLTAKGWSLDAKWSADGAEDCVVLDTLIDRAAVTLPLNWKIGTAIPPLVNSMTYRAGADIVSTMSVTVLDDLNDYSLAALTTGSSAAEWRLLSFINDESRPIWSGFIEGISHSQDSSNQTLETIIEARDSAAILDRILPIWETGQNAHFSLNQHIAMDAINTKRFDDTTNLHNTLLFGGHFLTVSENTLGFNKYDTNASGTAYVKNNNARTHLYSGQSIQMYNNEDQYGPNDVEDNWEGGGAEYTGSGGVDNNYGLQDIIAYSKDDDTGNLALFVKYDDATPPTFGATTHSAVTISSYRGYSNGQTFTLKGTTGYDGNYTIDNMVALRRMNRNSSGGGQYPSSTEYHVKIVTTTTMPTGTSDVLFSVSEFHRGYYVHGDVYTTKQGATGAYIPAHDPTGENEIQLKITATGAHGLSVGDWVIFPDGMDPNTNDENYYAMARMQVSSVESATIFNAIVPNDSIGASSTIHGASTAATYAKAYDLTKINPHAPPIAHRIPKIKPVIYNTLPTGGFDRIKHSRIHARWMRDLPLSPFFRAQFGIIDPIPYWRSGLGSALNHVLSPQHIVAHGSTGYNADGTVTGWAGINQGTHSSGLTSATTSITFDEPGLWYFIKKYNMEDNGIILDLLDTETGESQYCIANAITNPGHTDAITWSLSAQTFTISGGNNVVVGDIVIHEGFRDFDLNGIFQVTEASTSKIYKVSRINYEPMINEFSYIKSVYQTGSQWSLGSAHYFDDPDAINIRREFIDFNAAIQTVPTNAQVGVLRKGGVVLSGIKGIKGEFDVSKCIYTLRKVDEDNGYKHLYVLWADMRNDGTANADGGHRQTDFGMILPTSNNYKVNVCFADQFDEKGDPDVFCELKIGEDVDIWQFDADTEPYYGTSWSSLRGGSNDEPLDTRYHDWNTKGGSFVIIDASRFFNLNTAATGGRAGYNSGGLVDFGDYILASEGFPYLTDAYWKAAIPSYQNVIHAGGIAAHNNSLFMLNDMTYMSAPTNKISIGDTILYVADNTIFDTSGTGVIICQKGDSRNQEDLVYYFSWTGKGSVIALNKSWDRLTGVFITSLAEAPDPATIITLVASERAGYASPASRAEIDVYHDPLNPDAPFKQAWIYNTPSALYPLRLSVNLEGIVRSQNVGTYYANDKMRSIYSLATADTWGQNTNVPCIYEMPKTRKMKKSVASTTTDDFGSIFDGKNMTIMKVASAITKNDGSGIGGELTNFSWFMDRDNILTIRQQIPSGIAFTRANLLQSSMSTKLGSQVTNVRVYYNGNSNFADYPEPSGQGNTRWRVLNHPKIFSSDEALSIAKQEYLSVVDSQVSIMADVLLQGTETSKMLSGGRYGYVQDTLRRSYLYDRKANASWTNLWGGMLFTGVQNILHSNNKRFAHLTSGTEPTEQGFTIAGSGTVVHAIPDSVDPHDKGIQIRTATGVTIAHTGIIGFAGSGSTVTAVANLNSAGYGATITLATGWNTVIDAGANKVSIYCESGFSALTPSANVNLTFKAGIPRRMGYPHYGTASLTPCLKVVHVEKNTPKVSDTTGEELRLAITIDGAAASGKAARPVDDNAQFKLWLLDVPFDKATTGAPSSEIPPEYDISSYTSSHHSNVQIVGNGLYSVQVPTTYSSTPYNVIFSVDYDYLQAVLRRDEAVMIEDASYGYILLENAHNIMGSSYGSTSNVFSGFPLGVRFDGALGQTSLKRAYYYAPRLAIVDDMTYTPAMSVTLTDTHIDLTNEVLNIDSITWDKKDLDVDNVKLDLQRTEKQYRYTLASMFKYIGENSPSGPDLPPATPPSSRPLGPLGYGAALVPVASGINTKGLWGGGSPSSLYQGLSMNVIGTGSYRGLKGRANFKADVGLATGNFGIIGMENQGTALSSDRDVDGIESSLMSSEGVSIMTSDGFTLGGVVNPELGAQGEINSHSINVRIPNDVSSGGFVGVIAQVTFENSSSLTGEITTTILCAETGVSSSQTITIPSTTSGRQSLTLFHQNVISGANVAGNTLNVKIERKPAQGNDNAGFNSITFNSLSVKMRRYSNSGEAQSNSMKPY